MIYKEEVMYKKIFKLQQILISILSSLSMDISLAIFNHQMDLKTILLTKILMIINKLNYFKIVIFRTNFQIPFQFSSKINSDNQLIWDLEMKVLIKNKVFKYIISKILISIFKHSINLKINQLKPDKIKHKMKWCFAKIVKDY